MKEIFIKTQSLGQTGFRFEFAETVVFIDPYLSNSVQEKESADLVRLKPILIQPSAVTDADWVIITHEHRDHCDIETLLPISIASKHCRFMGPPKVATMLIKAGIDSNRIETAKYGVPLQLNTNCKVLPVPSAHPILERDTQGRFHCLGYIIKIVSKTIYHAGDTSPDERVIRTVKKFGEEIGVKEMIPTHWDMFEANSVYREEIELLYKKISPAFSLSFVPDFAACTTLIC